MTWAFARAARLVVRGARSNTDWDRVLQGSEPLEKGSEPEKSLQPNKVYLFKLNKIIQG